MDDKGLGLGVLHLDLQEVTPAEQAKLFFLGHMKFIWHHEELWIQRAHLTPKYL